MMTIPRRRRPAHRAPRRRRLPYPIIAIAVMLIGLSFPVAKALSGGPDRKHPTLVAPPTTDRRSTIPRETLGTIPRTVPGIRIQVVPGVRDVKVRIDGTVHATNARGVIDLPNTRGTVDVTYLGFFAKAPAQQVAFRWWSDGSTAPSRPIDANGRGHLSVAVDLRYRVTVFELTGGGPTKPGGLTASTQVGPVTFPNGSPLWVLAERGQGAGPNLVTRHVTYSFRPPGGPSEAQVFSPAPEAQWVIRAD